MGALAEKLSYLSDTKTAIKNAIVEKGVSVADSDTFRSYADKIASIQAGGGGSGSGDLDALTEGSLTEINSNVTIIRNNAFSYCNSLASIDFPLATSIGINAFSYCSSLTSVSFPKATSIGNNAFYYCSSLTIVSFPKAKSIGTYAFRYCSKLTIMYIGTESNTVCTLSNTGAIPSSVTSIYVPASLVSSYKSATNWSSFASKIYPDGYGGGN